MSLLSKELLEDPTETWRMSFGIRVVRVTEKKKRLQFPELRTFDMEKLEISLYFIVNQGNSVENWILYFRHIAFYGVT